MFQGKAGDDITSLLLDYKWCKSCFKVNWITLVLSWWEEVENINFGTLGMTHPSQMVVPSKPVFNQLEYVACGTCRKGGSSIEGGTGWSLLAAPPVLPIRKVKQKMMTMGKLLKCSGVAWKPKLQTGVAEASGLLLCPSYRESNF